jgi:transposase
MKHNRFTSQNQRIERISENTLVIGTDIAKELHVARAFNFRGIELGKRILFTNEEDGLLNLLVWAESLKTQHQLDNVILGVEPTGHYWFSMFHFLIQRSIQVVLVNPHHVKKSKELDDNSPTKNDTKDAKVIARLVIDGRYSEPHLPEGIYADLRVFMNQYERLTRDLGQLKNRIHNVIDRIFPEYAKVFKEWDGKASLITLRHVPLPQDIVNMGEAAILGLWREKGLGKGIGRKRAALLYQTACRSIGLIHGATAARHELAMDLEQYDLLCKQINQLLELVKQLLVQIHGAQEMLTIPCVGLVTVAGFLAEVGDLQNYHHAQQIVRHAGLGLWENSSGKHKGKTTINKRGRRRLRALLYRAGMVLVAKNAEFRALHAYFTKRPNNPLKKKQSMIAICNKLIRILFEIGRKQKHYDSAKVLGPIRQAQMKAVA